MTKLPINHSGCVWWNLMNCREHKQRVFSPYSPPLTSQKNPIFFSGGGVCYETVSLTCGEDNASFTESIAVSDCVIAITRVIYCMQFSPEVTHTHTHTNLLLFANFNRRTLHVPFGEVFLRAVVYLCGNILLSITKHSQQLPTNTESHPAKISCDAGFVFVRVCVCVCVFVSAFLGPFQAPSDAVIFAVLW